MKRTISAMLLGFAITTFASEEEYARNREIRVLPETIAITAEYPEPHGRTTVAITVSQTNGTKRITSISFKSQTIAITVPRSLTDDMSSPQLEQTALTYSSGMRTDEGLYASVTIPWGEVVTNATHRFKERTFCIVGGRLSLVINKYPKDNWYDTDLKRIEDTQPSGGAYVSPEAGSPSAHP